MEGFDHAGELRRELYRFLPLRNRDSGVVLPAVLLREETGTKKDRPWLPGHAGGEIQPAG